MKFPRDDFFGPFDIDYQRKMRFLYPLFVNVLDIFQKSTVGLKTNKLKCIREIPELQVDNEKVLSYRIRFPAISVRRNVFVAKFSTFYARRQFCTKISDAI